MKFRPQMQLRFRGEAQFNAIKDLAGHRGMNEWVLLQIETLNPHLAGEGSPLAPKKVKPKVKKALALALAALLMAGSAWGQKALPKAKLYDSGSWGCPSPYWPFQSWTHEWSCVKGEFEAKSTWNLYRDNLFVPFSTAGSFVSTFKISIPDPETSWYVQYLVDGEGYKCDSFRRKDGLVHSLIIGQEYTQTCDSGKLGLLVPVKR